MYSSLFLLFTGFITLRPQLPPPEVATPYILTGTASRYDYLLPWLPNYSMSHRTCAMRILPKYSTWKVCNIDNWKCIECFQNDYWPKEYTNRIIDLSSYAFSLIGNTRKWLMNVRIEKIEN